MPIESIWDLPDIPKGQLPPHLELQRTRVLCNNDAPTHTENVQYSGAYAAMGVDNSMRFDQFCDNFKVEVIKLNEDDIEFDLIGIDPSIANAFRRILIAEVPTMAIEKVFIAKNTSVVQDEVLAHRLGLIPIKVDPRLFEYLSESEPNEKNTIVFKLHVRCERGAPRLKVKSNELKWLPNGSELKLATEKSATESSSKPKIYTNFNCGQDSLPEFSNDSIAPKDPDIIISKLGAGQEIELEAHAVKGMGKTHAKWSPVATAWYRMLPEVVLLQDIKDREAEELVKRCPLKVFDIEDTAKGKLTTPAWRGALGAPEFALFTLKFGIYTETYSGATNALNHMQHFEATMCLVSSEDDVLCKALTSTFTGLRATVVRPRACTLCRECIRRDGWDKKVALRRKKDHFIFNIESTGALPPEVLFTEAVKILEEKCERVITELS